MSTMHGAEGLYPTGGSKKARVVRTREMGGAWRDARRCATSRCICWCWRRCSSGVGYAVKSFKAQGTEQIRPREPGQCSSGHGGLSGVRSVEVSAIAKSVPLVSLSGSAPVGGLGGCILICLVEERVDTRVGRTKVSSFIGGAGRAHGPVSVLFRRDTPVTSGASSAFRGASRRWAPFLRRRGGMLRLHIWS